MNGRLFMPEPARLGYTFGGLPAVEVIKPGQLVTIGMQDCFGGRVTGPDTLPSAVCDLSRVNPVTGPFYVEGAEPGDTLAVHLISLVPARDWAVSATVPHFGALTSSDWTPMLHPALQERVWRYALDLDAGIARFRSADATRTVDLPVRPMIGTIGVSPGGGQAITTLTSGPHGGNMDTACISGGVTVYLPVNVPGALFALGDGHALQGDGEVCGVAVECAMTATVILDVIKSVTLKRPRLESDSELLVIGYGRPLEDAYRAAQADLVGWLQVLTGMDQLDCLQLLSQAGRAQIGNVCDPAYTIAAAIPKSLLPNGSASAYGGAHERLRHHQ